MLKKEIEKIILASLKSLNDEKLLLFDKIPSIAVEIPEDSNRGDYSTNIALVLAKNLKRNPFEIAEIIRSKIEKKNIFEKVETAHPGFLNFWIAREYLENQVQAILKEKDRFGSVKSKREKINIEFISANPTGPLTLGNGRGGFCGDVLSNVLERAGFQITKEYYINNAGGQVEKLGHSVIGDDQAVYRGDYITSLRKQVGDKDPAKAGGKAARIILREMIKPGIKKMGIDFDVWFSEEDLYKRKKVDKAIEYLQKEGLTYEQEGALWFTSKQFGDDKDRVLVKAGGEKTYFASEVAYLQDKIRRGFDKIIIFLGADHHGYVPRIKAAAHAVHFKSQNFIIIIMQLVRLFQDGREVRMSKRSGTYVTLDELLEKVPIDAARFFFLMRGYDTHLNFNINLAQEQSQNNPVYYVQYAYARINSILRKTKTKRGKIDLSLLKEEPELQLIKELIRFPDIIQDVVHDWKVQRLTQYATDLADVFHRFYETCRVLSDDQALTRARLTLLRATRVVLKNTFEVMGIGAPEKM